MATSKLPQAKWFASLRTSDSIRQYETWDLLFASHIRQHQTIWNMRSTIRFTYQTVWNMRSTIRFTYQTASDSMKHEIYYSLHISDGIRQYETWDLLFASHIRQHQTVWNMRSTIRFTYQTASDNMKHEIYYSLHISDAIRQYETRDLLFASHIRQHQTIWNMRSTIRFTYQTACRQYETWDLLFASHIRRHQTVWNMRSTIRFTYQTASDNMKHEIYYSLHISDSIRQYETWDLLFASHIRRHQTVWNTRSTVFYHIYLLRYYRWQFYKNIW